MMRQLRILPVAIAAACVCGCAMMALKDEIEVVEQWTQIEGVVEADGARGKPIIVIIQRDTGGEREVAAVSLMLKPGPFRFVKEPGRYFIVAFEDTNGDFAYQEDEFAGHYGSPTPLVTNPGVHFKDIVVALQPPGKVRLEGATDLSSPAVRETLDWKKVSYGEVTMLENPAFTPEYGSLGLWEPLRVLTEIGAGVYFLEEYDKNKIPVLFVHGVGGNPSEWKHIIAGLDRSRYQPWVAQYPSAFRLNTLGEFYTSVMSALLVAHDFEEYAIVAHSMGGLVSRAYIDNVADSELADRLRLFVSISTPWQGHEAAAMGVERSPVVVPSWLDVAPGSEFLQGIRDTPLPLKTAYHLFFSYQGSSSFAPGNDDGTVSLSSQLAPTMQESADRVIGFDEGHVSILSSDETSRNLNALLQRAFPE